VKRTWLIILICILIAVVGCNRDEPKVDPCPPFALVYSPAFSDPIWHPSGDFIGFNYRPIVSKDISRGTEKCPRFIYDDDQRGFYLIDEDGSNLRKILDYELQNPTWSPDGDWIAFSAGGRFT